MFTKMLWLKVSAVLATTPVWILIFPKEESAEERRQKVGMVETGYVKTHEKGLWCVPHRTGAAYAPVRPDAFLETNRLRPKQPPRHFRHSPSFFPTQLRYRRG